MGKTPAIPWELGKLVRGLKVPGALKLVTVFPSMSWLFAVMAKTRRVCVSFKGLHLVELKIEDFS